MKNVLKLALFAICLYMGIKEIGYAAEATGYMKPVLACCGYFTVVLMVPGIAIVLWKARPKTSK